MNQFPGLLATALSVAAVPVASLFPTIARAEVTGSVDAATRYSDNVFAQPDGTELAPGISRSDWVYSANADAKATVRPLDFTIDADGSVNYSKFNHNTQFDNFGYSFALDVNRDPGSRLDITGEALVRQNLSSFASLGAPIRNEQNLISADLRLSWIISGDIAFVVTPKDNRSVNSAPLLEQYNYNAFGSGVGIGLQSPLGNYIDLTFNQVITTGLGDRMLSINSVTYNDPISLKDTSVNLEVNYMTSPLMTVKGKVYYVWRDDRSLLHHNYNAPFGELLVQYTPRDSLMLTAKVGRKQETQDQLFVDSVKTTYAGLTAKFDVTDFIELNGSADYYHRFYQYDPTIFLASSTTGSLQQTDNLLRLQAGVLYAFSPRLALGLNGMHDNRTSTSPFYTYHSNSFQITLVFAFGQSVAPAAPKTYPL